MQNKMKHTLATILVLLLWVVTSLAQTRGIEIVPIKDKSGKQVGIYKSSHALIFGVSEYTAGWPKLPSVIGETEKIETALKLNGFNVRRIINPNDDVLKSEFERFIDDYGYNQDNRLLIFFSGHGYSRNQGEKGYLVPVDAPDPRIDEMGFLRKALPMNQILAWCRQIEAKHALFLFDSCFSGTIFKSKALPKIPPHISIATSRPVRQFIAAGDAGEEVPAKSVFATCFLRALRGDADYSKDGYVTGTELGMYLNEKLLYYNTGQTPQYGKIRDPDLDEGDFVFTLCRHKLNVSELIDTPSKLLEKIYLLASQKRYDDLRSYIYPFIRGEFNVQDFIIKGVKENKKTGDFAYSNLALKEIVEKYLYKIQPLESKHVKELFLSRDNFGLDPLLKQIALSKPNDIMMFDYKGVHTLIVKIDGEYKLLFWERMNRILQSTAMIDFSSSVLPNIHSIETNIAAYFAVSGYLPKGNTVLDSFIGEIENSEIKWSSPKYENGNYRIELLDNNNLFSEEIEKHGRRIVLTPSIKGQKIVGWDMRGSFLK